MRNKLASVTGQVNYVQKGEPGAPGASLDRVTWEPGKTYYSGAVGELVRNIAIYNGVFYLCTKTHISADQLNPKDNVATGSVKYWSVATQFDLIKAEVIDVENLRSLLIQSKKIQVDEIDADGLTANNVKISGEINAYSGVFGGSIRTSLKNLEDSDASYVGGKYTLKNDLQIIATTDTIKLPVSIDYLSTRVVIVNPYLTLTRTIQSTYVMSDGIIIGGAVDYYNTIDYVELIGGCVEFLAIKNIEKINECAWVITSFRGLYTNLALKTK